MSDFAREHHRVIARLSGALDGAFLARCNCYFGGGTMLALLLGEYRESRAIDFLCANRSAYRALREAVQADSLGGIQQHPVQLVRQIRADRDGIRTVPSFEHAAAEKLLTNANPVLNRATLGRSKSQDLGKSHLKTLS